MSRSPFPAAFVRPLHSFGIVVVSLSVLAAAEAPAGLLPVVNPSFEDVDIVDGQYTGGAIGLDGWTTLGNGTVGLFDPLIPAHFNSVPEGDQTAYTHGVTLVQALPHVVVEGVEYVLRVDVGYCTCTTYGGYRTQLWADSVLIAEDDNTLVPSFGDWITSETSYSSPAGDPHAGKDLEIRIAGLLAPGFETNFDNVRLTDDSTPTGIAADPSRETFFRVGPATPNPLRNTTRVALALDRAARVSLGIYDVNGRHLNSLFEGSMAGGTHALIWDGRNDRGRPVPNGVYFLRVSAANVTEMRKVVIAR